MARDYKYAIWKLIIITSLYCPSLLQADVQFEGMGFLSESFSGRYALANAISDDGLVAVGFCITGPPAHGAAFRWTHAGGMQELPFTEATAVSADGTVVVGYKTIGTNKTVAIRWTEAGGAVQLGYFPGGNSSVAQAVSNDGTVVTGGLALSVHGSLNRVALLYSRKVALSSVPGLSNRPEDMGDILK